MKTASRGPKGNSTGALPLSEPPAPPKTDAASPPPAPPRATAHFGRTGPNASQAVWAIAPAGVASQVFACDQEVLLSVAARPEGGIAVGTGNSGQCFLVGRDGRLTRWVNLEEGQAMAFLRRSNGDLLVGTGNPGRVRSLSEAAATTGTLTTEALDAGLPSRWGRVSWRTRGQGEIRIATRSGNSERPDAAWSDWSAALSAPEGSSISSPPGRFLQVRLSLAGRAGKDSPVLESLRLNYLPANAAPSIDSLEVTSPVAEVYAEHREPSIKERDRQFEAAKKRPPLGMRRIKWDASDPNRDRLSALLFLREAKEKSWRPLLDEPTAASEYDWDVRNTPDGVYRVKVVVSDGWSNPPGTALSASRESEAFVVDTSPPAISTPQLAVASGVATVTATVEDSTSNILSLEYLLDSGDWTPTAPKDGFADSRREELAMELRGLSPGEHALALRARDEAGNVANVRLVIDAR
ncbi:MAG: hypothetical protein HY303_16000 [Candidatus Wallbacteria bacterium]|nr:hypothetical protein [Candidatus Wallbacteria bacterium]